MLSVFSAVLLCAQSVAALAADSTSNTTAANQQIRVQVEAKRDQLSGADKISPDVAEEFLHPARYAGNTDDAPAQAQRP
ncbi:hypothetical protein F2S71_26045 [Pseudomonas syringae pv. actinidiae]|nr:hypothetical protein [Pseudomonas syringae pv. actinidiae]